jgi:superfamily II RNA helicase
MTLLKLVLVKPKPNNRLPEGLAELVKALLSAHITSHLVKLYRDKPKDLQVEVFLSLVQGRHTFVCAGTGLGKTRISEMYFGLFDRKFFVLVFVPLDS